MNKKSKTTPEQRIQELSYKGLKKVFLFIVALITYWQLYEYFNESPEINISLEKSNKTNNSFKTLISIKNGSQSISSIDIIRPLKIEFNDTIRKIESLKSEIKTKYEIQEKSLIINFDLINKNEDFKFYVFTSLRPEIKKIDYRIKNIENIEFYDYLIKPKPIYRILNIWIILLSISLILFIDALLVIAKDKELGEIKSFISNFPLTLNNMEQFVDGYTNIYKNYTLRFKPNSKFMNQIMRNLFITITCKTTEDIHFIKYLANLKTELYTFYRTRTAFIIISPIVILISITAIFLNYFYYEIDILKTYTNINSINKTILTILFILSSVIILFPRKSMNLLFLKKDAEVKF
ncbi:MAG: hypothetical protein Q8S44_04180 [Flavobacteriaceae bacterium]|nr:hypothetical protein [Flavobacteriaceae bacterium]